MKISVSQYAAALLAAQSDGKIAPGTLVQNFLGRLKKRGDLTQARKILNTLEKVIRTQSGEEHISIETAYPITLDLQKELLEKAKNIFPEKKLTAEFLQNKSLIAGYRMQSQTHLFDNSAQAALKDLAQACRKI